jgi:hypothetical protein
MIQIKKMLCKVQVKCQFPACLLLNRRRCRRRRRLQVECLSIRDSADNSIVCWDDLHFRVYYNFRSTIFIHPRCLHDFHCLGELYNSRMNARVGNVTHSASSDRPKCEGFCVLSFRFRQGQRDSTGEESDPLGCHVLQLYCLHFCYVKTYFPTLLFISWQLMLYMNIHTIFKNYGTIDGARGNVVG